VQARLEAYYRKKRRTDDRRQFRLFLLVQCVHGLAVAGLLAGAAVCVVSAVYWLCP